MRRPSNGRRRRAWRAGFYIARAERRTFAEVAALFLKERQARNRRTNTLACYESMLDCHLLPAFGLREVGMIRRSDIAEHFDAMREGKAPKQAGKPASVATINRAVRTMKAVLFFALERELVERNVMQRFRPFEVAKDERGVSRDAFSEAEVQAILAEARPHERALIGLLCFTGLRPGEAYALDWAEVDLTSGCVRVVRSWDQRGRKFVEPKTRAGSRVVPLSGWLVGELTAHKGRSDGVGLVFPTRTGNPMNPSNVRRDIWLPLKKRAGVRGLDLYSLRHTFASLGRTAGESAFNVARMMGHSRSTLVDAVYAHTMQSGMASVAESVTARALGLRPQLRVIEGGARDVREPLEQAAQEPGKNVATR